jgi:hypothetical protein
MYKKGHRGANRGHRGAVKGGRGVAPLYFRLAGTLSDVGYVRNGPRFQ